MATEKSETIKINLNAQSLPAGLYLVGTPIGYLKDISLRALETFMSVDVVACEDTRVTGKLLHHYGIQVKKIKYNDHSDERVREEIFSRIERGESVALCSDAGLPLIADPGYKLVRECVERGVYVTSIPGACAALTGLQLSGLATDEFLFAGFVPNKKKAREDLFSKNSALAITQVYYETAVRIVDCVEAIASVMGDRHIVVTRELTKSYEEVISGTCSDVLTRLKDQPIKGEVVLIVSGERVEKSWDDEAIIKALRHEMVDLGASSKDAVKSVMAQSGWAKKQVYAFALDVKEQM